MVRGPCFDSNGIKKGAWSEEEDNKLRAFVLTHGHSNWRLLPKYAGLARCGKSCRLRWVNYLKPGVRRGNFTIQEEDLIIKLHAQFGKKWSIIATYFPGRTDNDIKNFWNAHIEKRRKRNPDAKKIKLKTSEAYDVPKEEKLSPASLIKFQEHTLPFDATFSQGDQLDLWPMFPLEEGFFYDDQRYRELSCSETSYIMNHDIMPSEYVDQPVQGNLLSEYLPLDHTSNFQNGDIAPPLQEEGGYYGNFSDQCFSYGMHFLS